MAILTPNKLYKDIDFAFEAHPETKDILKKIDINSVKQSLKTLLFTRAGERLFQPDVGGNLHALLFEPIDNITAEVIKKGIENTIEKYERRVKLDLIDVVPKYDDNEYEISIYFSIVGINQPTSLTLTLERLR